MAALEEMVSFPFEEELACSDGVGAPSWCTASARVQCRGWAARGECTKNPNYMKVCCAGSCNSCPQTSKCKNGHGAPSWCRAGQPHCHSWAVRGECNKNPKYMKVCCAGSCNSCAAATTQNTQGTCKTAGIDVFHNRVHASYVD